MFLTGQNTYRQDGFEGRMWDLIVSVSDHCLSFYFTGNKCLSGLDSFFWNFKPLAWMEGWISTVFDLNKDDGCLIR